MAKKQTQTQSDLSKITIRGARQHNLKNIDLEIPANELTVITGPSGSGKSSLAFHTLYAEGQRRYVETFSPYVRQFMDRMDKPAVDRIDGIPPAIAIEQKNTIRTTRSTVGTLTELNDYLKVVFPRLAKAYDPSTGEEIIPDTPASILDWAKSNITEEKIIITFPVNVPLNSSTEDIFNLLNQQAYLRIYHKGEIYRTDDENAFETVKLGTKVEVIQDRITLSNKKRFTEALEQALHLGKGNCTLRFGEKNKQFTTQWKNPNTGFTLRPPSASMFSFNSPLGACEECRGFGKVIGIDLKKAVQDPSLSIMGGCVKPFEGERGEECKQDLIRCAKEAGISTTTPWYQLKPHEQEWILKGEKGDADALWRSGEWYGVRGFFDWMETKSYKMHVRVFLSRYRAYTDCPSCSGSRLKPDSLCFKIKGLTLPDLWQMPVTDLLPWFEQLKEPNSDKTTNHALTEVQSRLRYMVDVGLGYLTLDRQARTLSGGEIERVNLTTCLGAALTNTLFVLDEPTVGLHARDIKRLVNIMHNLRDKGNTVVVVEHEEAVMKSADNIIDMGPQAGEHGGEIVAVMNKKQVSLKKSLKDFSASTTLPYLQGNKSIPIPNKKREVKEFIRFMGAHQHNISNLDISLPVGVLACLTGVSGSGKSTLAHDVIYLNLAKHFLIPNENEPAPLTRLKDADLVTGVELVDQSPLTKTPRSTPAVYSGAFDAIRELFASTDEAKAKKLKPGYFSFNAGAGRCERCWGNGYEKVEMQFLSDLYITCPECNGQRYHKTALSFTYEDLSIAQVLEMTISEAIEFFTPKDTTKNKINTQKTKLVNALSPMQRVGLGYLRLGQPLNTLSGGESQRLKLCQLLSKTQTQVGKILILDEPTTGLHFTDIEKLLVVFQDLVEAGHSLLVIEHQTDVIKAADYVIDMGPGAGEDGGQIVFSGTPEELTNQQTETSIALRGEDSAAVKALTKTSKDTGSIDVFGAREHNLKNFDISIPRDELVVVTGLSGSGKSTLSFDIIFAEGQRRFLDSMSPYARQFAGQLEKPYIDKITGLPPTVAIEQRVSRGGGKSTVGTVTEIYHFMRLLYAKLGIQHCPDSGEPVVTQTVDAIVQQVAKKQKERGKKWLLLAQLIKARKGFHTDVAEVAGKKGIKQLLVDGILINTAEFTPLARYKEHDIYAVIPDNHDNLTEAIEFGLKLGKGQLALAQIETAKRKVSRKMMEVEAAIELLTYSTKRVSPVTGKSFEEPDPHHFSFNSPRGWCPECRGYGKITVSSNSKKKKKRSKTNEFNSQAEAELAEEIASSRAEKDEDSVTTVCPSCQGDRLREDSRHVYINGLSIGSLNSLPVKDLSELLAGLKFTGREALIARDIIPEITQRLHFLDEVGLNYLSLDRSADTLSGGESQRIRLAAQLGSNLQGVLYVLDEPTIGLHPRDNEKLLDTLELLRNRGNSLLVVEHDDETMRRAGKIIDLGPGAGVLGGDVIAELEPKHLTQKTAVKRFPKSTTLQAMTHPIEHPTRGKRRTIPKIASKEWLKLTGCNHNNLKNIDVRIPLGRLTVISGVSGCGKSSFMRGTLAPAAKGDTKNKSWSKLSGFNTLKHCFEVDQTPIGKTSRSCPATYVKIFDEIRKLFAQLPESKMRGYTASRFSFNNSEGQCPECKGNGRIKLEMDFLPTTRVTCESCREMRYNDPTLEVRYNEKSIGDVLRMNISEAAEFFSAHSKLSRVLKLLNDTGLGYLQLGQASPTLSGGEAQRIKLVAELAKGRAKLTNQKVQNKNLYLIEEPTIGLHQEDVRKLIDVLHRLVDEGHTVVVIEHHTAIMAEADYLIDMGPEAGDHGGTIVAQGTPEKVAANKKSVTARFLREVLTTKGTERHGKSV